MILTIDINIEAARKVLETCSGSVQEMNQIQGMDDEGIKDLVIKHSKCWGISEVKK